MAQWEVFSPVYTIQPVVKRVWQPVVSCKRGLRKQFFCGLQTCSSTSSETKSSLPAASAAEAPSETSPAVTGSDAESVASWQLEVFGAWRTLSDTESAHIEKAYCDPSNDTVSMSVVVCMLQLIFSIVTNYFSGPGGGINASGMCACVQTITFELKWPLTYIWSKYDHMCWFKIWPNRAGSPWRYLG